MPLTLDSCYPIHHPESFTYRDATHVGKYNFVAEPGDDIKMSGNYKVSTFLETTRSTVEVELKVELPYNLDWKTGFGVYWGLGYSEWETEYFGAGWSPNSNGWNFRSWTRNEKIGLSRTQDELVNACYGPGNDNVWRITASPRVKDNHLIVKAKRYFDVKDKKVGLFKKSSARDIYTHSQRYWYAAVFD